MWTFFFIKKKKNLFFSIYLLSITKISDCQFLTGGNDIVADIFSSLFGFLSCTEKQYQPAPQASQAQGNECSGLMVVYFSYWLCFLCFFLNPYSFMESLILLQVYS